MKYLILNCFLFILLVINFPLKAQDTSALSSDVFVPQINEPLQFLQQHLLVLEDKNGKFRLDDLFKSTIRDSAFHKASALSKPDAASVWWCKINIEPSFSSNDFFIGVPLDASSGLDNGNDIADVWIVKKMKV